jgi:hypothetical protein
MTNILSCYNKLFDEVFFTCRINRHFVLTGGFSNLGVHLKSEKMIDDMSSPTVKMKNLVLFFSIFIVV